MTVHHLQVVLWTIALGALTTSAYTDIRDRIIPNRLVGVVAVCGLAIGLLSRPEPIWISLSAAVLVLLALGMLAHHGVMGGGDAKMIAAATLLVPASLVGKLLIFIVLAGGLLSCLYIAVRYALRIGVFRQSHSTPGAAGGIGEGRWLSRECARIAKGGSMPYGVAIACGVAAVLAMELPPCLPEGYCSFLA